MIDYLWGHPTEALLAAITGADFARQGSRTGLIHVGESAAAALRSSGLEIMGDPVSGSDNRAADR